MNSRRNSADVDVDVFSINQLENNLPQGLKKVSCTVNIKLLMVLATMNDFVNSIFA